MRQASQTIAPLQEQLQRVHDALDELSPEQLDAIVAVLLRARNTRHRVFVLGNGGSAASASHFANDLRAVTRQEPRLVAYALADNTAVLTALANDFGYETVFSDQIASDVNEGDVVVALSVSGESENVLRALQTARYRGAVTVGLFGNGGGSAAASVDLALTLSSRDFGVVEGVHATVLHLLAAELRRRLAEGVSAR